LAGHGHHLVTPEATLQFDVWLNIKLMTEKVSWVNIRGGRDRPTVLRIDCRNTRHKFRKPASIGGLKA
jgi:hypothetical protein